ncbi:glucuronate isomerase [Halobacillus salinarum]|uniref:Uronate isomerase n=1 Tax=Halobacillus salinarum TaxID=2932257 RepID=A0ABY4EM99_9BACI|nr:glucuronate isomerase [Halobacillus salinarum]UOQ45576.1 glucuronate isomerase [Halobacillus salinarum]
MTAFITDDFLLTNDLARELYHDYAKDLPIIDFHNHLPPEEIANNDSFGTITDVWLGGDHYKWRLMRANGIDEHYITGGANHWEKFEAWAETVPNTLGNPLFHWTQMELKRYFDIDEILTKENAARIYETANEELKQSYMLPRSLLINNHVEFVGTTDDPADSLTHHADLAKDEFPVTVAPSFRPDKALDITSEYFLDWVHKLGKVTNKDISSFPLFIDALSGRIDYFAAHGCKASDHGISRMFFAEATEEDAASIFQKRLDDEPLTKHEVEQFQTYALKFLAERYCQKGWVMQFHLGPMRNNNTRMLKAAGKDSGFDSIGDELLAEPLSRFLDSLDMNEHLPKTILYCLNPRDNYILATMAGNFQDCSVPGKVQFGPAWWFNDHIDGMEDQMKILANVGLIKHFVGMLTDSRSFLSFSRHEYFRRILCDMMGRWAVSGRVPADTEWLGRYVQDISYYNAQRYFNL